MLAMINWLPIKADEKLAIYVLFQYILPFFTAQLCPIFGLNNIQDSTVVPM